MKEVTLYGSTIDNCLKDLKEMAAADIEHYGPLSKYARPYLAY